MVDTSLSVVELFIGFEYNEIDKLEFVRVIMINFLNDIRNAENPISNNRKLINTIAILFLGIALGTFSKYLDFRQTELPGVLMAINGVLDIGNFLGRFAICVLEVMVFIIGLIVLRRDTLRSSALMGTISIVLAVLLDMVIPFHFG